MADSGGSVGFLTFGAWVFSVIAAVMAIDMYSLLRTGEFGRSWRVIIIASVILALTLGLRLGEIVNFQGMEHANLSQIGSLMFVMALAYAIFLQRQVFTKASTLRRRIADRDTDVAAMALRRDFFAPKNDGLVEEPSPFVRLPADLPVVEPLASLDAPVLSDDLAEDASADIEWSQPATVR